MEKIKKTLTNDRYRVSFELLRSFTIARICGLAVNLNADGKTGKGEMRDELGGKRNTCRK
ncbi:hypothetical protein [Cohnella mopanensis]|uniref:hypothetical protein n=1 Tax=Cohnella mopanensis TaxID=2911966 RepID=UPI001EF79909|nr:hypothetical protein [Cohnella mopanensis]